uniref:ATP synthase subunit a n=1 Tax=Ophiotreta durbanensis TaxID=3135534 RepID=A0AAU6PX73_9ECHI
MNMNLNNIFSQFNPSSLLSLPLTLIGGTIAISWIITTTNTHWINARNTLIFTSLNTAFNNLLGDQENIKINWNPWLFSIFILCLSYNLISLIPYTFSQTSHLSITFSLSYPIWLAIQTKGIQHNWKSKLSHLLPQGTPIFLIPLMIIIETLSLLIQPLTLGFRLGANLLAGHLLIFLCSCTIWEAINNNLIGSLSIILIITLLILEIAVACIQAAVFLILTKNYLTENLN